MSRRRRTIRASERASDHRARGLLAGLGLALVTIALATAGCGSERPEAGAGDQKLEAEVFPAIEEGMTMQQVLAAWGTPNVKVREGETERWSYWIRDHDRRVVGKTYVLFDDEEKVVEVVFPPEDPRNRAREPIQVTRSDLEEVPA